MINTLYLYRQGTTVVRNGASAERGFLVVGGVRYHTLERRGGYVTLPSGTFEIKMENSPTRTYQGSPRKQFRVYSHGVINNAGNSAAILIHMGNYPGNVTGCVAPGKTIIKNGVGNSADAMNEIFNFCGGFAVGKKLNLHVVDWAGPADESIKLQMMGVL